MRTHETQDAVAADDPAKVRVQIVVPVHTLDRPIRRAVESILADPHSGAIVVAHNLDPEDLDIPKDPRVHVVHLEGAQGKPGAAFDAGISAATAPWVGIMGSDDWFEQGSLDCLVSHGEEDGADFVLAPLAYQGGRRGFLPRTLRNRGLRAVRDRLFYRTAPLGIGRTVLMQEERFEFGATHPVGSDVEVSVRLWTSDLSISYFPDDPAYVVGADAKTRTTLIKRPLSVHGAAWKGIWEDLHLATLDPSEREALAVKIMRVHVHGAVAARPHPEDWGENDFEWLSELMQHLLEEAPNALQSFRRSTAATLTSLAQGDMAGTLERLAEEEKRSIRGLVPHSVRGWVNIDGPVRNLAVEGLHSLGTRLRAAKDARGPAFGRGSALRGRSSSIPAEHDPAETDHVGATAYGIPIAGARPALLILSFSPVRNDARVRRQVELFRDQYRVTTCGFGSAPEGVVAHIELPANLLPSAVDGRLITLKQYRAAYWAIPAVRNAWRQLRGRTFDAVLADDIEALPLALRLRPRFGVHADLHEHYPSMHEYDAAWKRRLSPYFSTLVGRYLPRAMSSSTVSTGLQRAYEAQFGIRPSLVPNATPLASLQPTPVATPIRLVHSGACQRKRYLEIMLEAVQQANADVTLDLFLTPSEPRYLAEITDRFGDDPRITFQDPVPYEDLIQALNQYDVGVFILPPQTFSYKWALPNKFFDFIQARLGIIVGPSPEMAPLVEDIGNGAVCGDFGVASLVEVIESLSVEDVAAWKAASDQVAEELSGENASAPWEEAIKALMDGRP